MPQSDPACATVLDTPLGPLTLTASRNGLKGIQFGRHGVPASGPGQSHLQAATRQLTEYFKGARRQFELRLDLTGTPFQKRVWELLPTIPYGQTLTYGQLAVRLGSLNLSRAVGRANGANPVPIVYPCHRVIGQNGKLTGFGGGLDKKAFLLAHEAQEQQLFQL